MSQQNGYSPPENINTSRLTHLALLHVHQDRTNKMDFNDLYQTFVSSNERRESLRHRGGIILTRAAL